MSAPLSHIGRLAEDFLSPSRPGETSRSISFSDLHCPYLSPSGVQFECDGLTANQRADLQVYLPKLMADMTKVDSLGNNFIAMLVGIEHYGCLPDYPATHQDALALARVVINYVGSFDSHKMELFAIMHVVDLLNAWIKPPVRWNALPKVMTLCRSIFGNEWCDLFLPDCPDVVGAYHQSAIGFSIDRIIRFEKPPFMPGLCPEQDAVCSVPLPDLGMSS